MASNDSSNPMIVKSLADKSNNSKNSNNSDRLGKVRFDTTKSAESLDEREKFNRPINLGYGSTNQQVSTAPRPINEFILREMIQTLVEKGADLNALAQVNRYDQKQMYDMKHVTPLILAVTTLNMVAIDEFIRLGVNCNYQEPFTKIAAVHLACKLSRVDIVLALIERGRAKVNLKSKGDFTCIHWLAESERDDIGVLQLIMAHLRKSYLKDHQLEVENETFAAGLDEHMRDFINQTNNAKQTALMLAAMHNKQNLVKFLLDYDASIDAVDSLGMTAINYAKHNSCGYLLNSFNKVKKIALNKSTQNLLARPDSDLGVSNERNNSSGIFSYLPRTPYSVERKSLDANSIDSYISDEFDERKISAGEEEDELELEEGEIVEKF